MTDYAQDITIIPPKTNDERAALYQSVRQTFERALTNFADSARGLRIATQQYVGTVQRFHLYRLDGYDNFRDWASAEFPKYAAVTVNAWGESGQVAEALGIEAVTNRAARQIMFTKNDILRALQSVTDGPQLELSPALVDDVIRTATALGELTLMQTETLSIRAAADVVSELAATGAVSYNGASHPLPDEPKARTRLLKEALGERIGNGRTVTEDALQERIDKHSRYKRAVKFTDAEYDVTPFGDVVVILRGVNPNVLGIPKGAQVKVTLWVQKDDDNA
jgi:hypothetical protein